MNDYQLNSFTIGKIIGKGAYSSVVQAKYNGDIYALKIMTKKAIIRSKRKSTYETEKNVYSKIRHPNVLHCYGYFETPLQVGFVFEFLPNGNLAELIRYPNLDIKQIMRQVLMALAELHSNGIIHRDLKPQNILLDENMNVKLCDFGSAKLFDPTQIPTKGSFVGSPDLISPEIIHEWPQTPAIDLWDFGCLIYFCYTETFPFMQNTIMETYNKIEKCEYTIPSTVPRDAGELISLLLKLHPNERLGFGDESNGYQKILSHCYFQG